jgi:hypothetical protein
VAKFRRSGSSSTSSGALLLDWATNVWAVGTSADDVSALSTLDEGGTDCGLHRRCTSSRDGQDLLRVLATEATTQETAGTEVSFTSRTEGLQGRKTGWSGSPEDSSRLKIVVQVVGAQGWVFH